MNKLTVEKALQIEEAASKTSGIERILAAEVRRLHAAVEAVRALPRVEILKRYQDLLYRDEVLRILDGDG